MRETALAAVFFLVAVCLVAVSVANARASGTPNLRFTKLVPVQVKGLKFAPGETVRVVLNAGDSTRVRTIRVNAGGTFTVGFGTLPSADRCSGRLSLVARGAMGTRAVYKLPSLACPTGPPTTAPGPATRQMG
jgi:hypothetical protein